MSALTVDQGGLGAVSAEDLDLSKFFHANDLDLLNPDLALGTPDSTVAAAPALSASSSRQEVPGVSMPISPTPPILPSLVPSSPPLATVPSAATLPFGGMGMGMITPETLAAMNMHTINMGLMPPALNPLALFAAPQQFNVNPLDFGAAIAAATAAFSTSAGVVSPASLLSTAPSAPVQALLASTPQAMGAAMLRDGLARVHQPPLASPTAPTPPYSSPATPSTSPVTPPKPPVFGRTSSVASVSSPSSGLSSAVTSAPGSPEPFSAPGSNESLSSASTAGPVKPKKKRRPKPRMCELSEQQAQAKRDANRESARKCRERKREKEKVVSCEKAHLADENEQLRVALAAEKAKNEILAKILLEKEGYIAGLHKRLRLDVSV